MDRPARTLNLREFPKCRESECSQIYDATYFEVIEAEQQLYPAEDALAQTQRDQLLAVVDLYKALGGGWHLTDAQFSRAS